MLTKASADITYIFFTLKRNFLNKITKPLLTVARALLPTDTDPPLPAAPGGPAGPTGPVSPLSPLLP